MLLFNGWAINFSMVVSYASWSRSLVYSTTNNVNFFEMSGVIFCDCLPLKQGGLEPKTSLDRTCASLVCTSSWWPTFCILCCLTHSHVSTFLFYHTKLHKIPDHFVVDVHHLYQLGPPHLWTMQVPWSLWIFQNATW